jgi:RNA polymerase sigma-70 factor (ECF subfamily)
MDRPFGRLRIGRPKSLFVRAREDPASFGDVYLTYRDQVVRFFVRRVLDPELAFDLMAETFAEMFSGLRGFRGETEEQGRAWMWAIARNQLQLWRRRGEVERRNLERVGVPVPSLGPAEYERIEELADLARFKAILDQAASVLTDQQRTILREHIENERGYDELAHEFGTTVVALRMTVSRALRRLARELERLEALEDDESSADEELVT